MEDTQRVGPATPALSTRISLEDPAFRDVAPRLFPEPARQVSSVPIAAAALGLRGPLSSALGMGALLRDGTLGPLSDTQHDAIERLLASGADALRRLSDLQVWIGLEAGTVELECASCELLEVAEAARHNVADLMARRGHQLTMAFGGPMTVVGDRERLEQALTHLLDNAARYAPEGGRISLLGQRQGDNGEHAVLEVRDTGGGLPAPVLDRLFDGPRQAQHQLARRSGSAGLGLALAQRLLAAHHGHLELTPILGGTCARITLPAAHP